MSKGHDGTGSLVEIQPETGVYEAPLTLSSFVHPLLDEVLGEVQYHAEAGRMYQRYVVTTASVQPIEGTSIDGFFAATPMERDPHGWAALQQLGLAVTVSLYDRDEACFLDAKRLARCVDAAMRPAVQRYLDAYATPARPAPIGQPFVDVLLKPTRDRISAPFDGVTAGPGAATAEGDLDLAEDGLAIMQLALRPAPVLGLRYFRMCVTLTAAARPARQLAWRDTLSPPNREEMFVDGYELRFAKAASAGDACDILRVDDGARRSVNTAADEYLPLDLPATSAGAAGAQRAMTLHLRGGKVAPATVLVARVVTRSFDAASEAFSNKVERLDSQAVTDRLDALQKGGWRLATDRNLATPTGLTWAPVLSPDSVPSPFDSFAALAPEHWAQLAGEPGNAVRDALETLSQNLRLTAPDIIPWSKGVPGTADLRAMLGVYPSWSQRFLDHAAEPNASAALAFSLAAPIKAQPWRLAPDRHGKIGLSFLHDDRWAHARVFAVRPTGRYDNIAIGAGWVDAADNESLLPPSVILAAGGRPDVGYALAVSPRTERIEPPVILGSGLLRQAQGQHVWSIVLARHGEENLAFSNRSLFARLGTAGTALSFVRQYRQPRWPKALKAIGHGLPDYVMHPGSDKPASASATPEAASAITGASVRELARRHPALAEGADAFRVEGLLPHYRLTALVVARAGIVVSEVVTAVQDATPRAPLAGQNAAVLLGEPRLVVNDTSGVDMTQLRLVSHADLAEQVAFDTWLANAEATDIAWWPDPDVNYTLLRRSGADETTTEEEDAVVNLVIPGPGAPDEPPPQPFVVRCRGTRFHAGAAATITSKNARPDFILQFGLAFNEAINLPVLRRRCGLKATEQQRAELVTACGDFALIETEFRVSVQVETDPGDSASAARDLAANMANHLTAAIDSLADDQAWPELAALLAAFRADYSALAVSMEWALRRQRLLRERSGRVAGTAPRTIAFAPGPGFKIEVEPTAFDIVTLKQLPPDSALKALCATEHPLTRQPGGELWRLSREKLLGGASGFVVRAVDVRNAIESAIDSSGTPQWTAPGEIETPVLLPDWVEWAAP